MELNSFTHALLILNSVPTEIVIDNNQPLVCRDERKMKVKLINAISSNDGFIDLICYDSLALKVRNFGITKSSCCDLYYYGDYQITSNRDGIDRTIILCKNTKYFPSRTENEIEFSNSTMHLRSDDENDVAEHIVNIPGAQLVKFQDGYYGAFGATYTPIAADLPYEGACRFFLNPNCGYFYLVIEGTFEYIFTFRGLLFLFHAPFETFKTNPFPVYTVNQFNTTDLITDLRIRSICPSNDNFLKIMRLNLENGINDNSLLTGFITTGNVNFNKSIDLIDIKAAAGSGMYFYQNKSDLTTNYTGGLLYLNTMGSATIDLKLASISASVYTSESSSATSEFYSSSDYRKVLNDLLNTNITYQRTIYIKGCAGLRPFEIGRAHV